MNEVIRKAEEIALRDGVRPGSGHLLLAMIDGQGAATRTGKLLRRLRVTPAKVRTHLYDLGEELDSVTRSVEVGAVQLARSFRSGGPYPMHFLAAIAGTRESHGAQALEQLGLNPMDVRNLALRSLTGATDDLGAAAGSDISQRPAVGLPLSDQLKEYTANRAHSAPVAPQVIERPVEKPPVDPAVVRSQLKNFLDVRRELELKQKKTREQRAAQGETSENYGEQLVLAETLTEPEVAAPPVSRRSPTPSSTRSHFEPAPEFGLDAGEYPLLAEIGRNLTEEAALGRLDPIVGRAQEMERIADVLMKRRANSPCLIGSAGVGKTTVVEGLALKIARGELQGLSGVRIIELRPVDLLAGTSLRGALTERLTTLRAEVSAAAGGIVLFFDELHALLGSADGAEAIAELKQGLARGELPCVAATSDEDYVRYIEGDPAFARLFTRIEIEEPSEEEAHEIIHGVVGGYAQHHGVDYSGDALMAAVRLSARYIPERSLPDKAIALLDLAGARASRAGGNTVEPADLAVVTAEQIGVPAERLLVGDSERLLSLETELGARVIGHGHVLSALGETLRRNAAGFKSGRPIGSFLFLGPTGVGKTETAKALADILFPGGGAFVRLDMSEFAEAHAVARLIGAPPGYIGHEEGGQLTEAVRRRPYSLVLLDEIEKAHRDVIQTLLQVLDDGRLTDGRGRTVAFENTVIVMTSNLGADAPRHVRRQVGFGAVECDEADPGAGVADAVLQAARGAMPPELWNRIDEPMVFAPLTEDEVSSIAHLLLAGVARQLLREQEVQLEIGDGAVEALIALGGYDPELGARPMRRTVQRQVEGPIARLVLEGRLSRGDTLTVSGDDDQLTFDVSG